MTVMVEATGLAKSYGKVCALQDCQLSVASGEIYGLLGPNGAGKTTLLRLLMGFLKPTAGRCSVRGLDCHENALAVHRQVAYLPGEVRLFRHMTGDEVVRFMTQSHPLGDSLLARTMARRLDVDLKRRVAECSTGMKQKIGLAAVLGITAPLLILDEPTSNLDPTVRTELLSVLREIKEQGRTVLLSSHVLSESEKSCDRVGILRSGRLAHVQVMEELREQHRIRAEVSGKTPTLPAGLQSSVTVASAEDEPLELYVNGELSVVLKWLAELDLQRIRIEPVALQVVYERIHGNVQS